MRAGEVSRFVVAVALISFAYTAPVAADEPVTIQLGPATLNVPDTWLELEGDDFAEDTPANVVFLTPPPTAFEGMDGISTEGIEDIVILLRHRAFDGALSLDSIPLTLHLAEERYGVARTEDAALAFDDIEFDILRGGPTTNAGKSKTQPLILIGSVESPVYGTMLVSTRIEQPYTDAPQRRYLISAVIEARDAKFDAIIQLESSRRLQATDLGLVDVVARMLLEGVPE